MATYRVAAEIVGKGPYWAFYRHSDTYIWFALKFQTVLDITTNCGESRGPSLSHKPICVIVFGDTRSTVGAVSGHRAASVTQKIRFRSSVNQSNWMKGPRQEKMTNLGSRTGGKPQLRWCAGPIVEGCCSRSAFLDETFQGNTSVTATTAGELQRLKFDPPEPSLNCAPLSPDLLPFHC